MDKLNDGLSHYEGVQLNEAKNAFEMKCSDCGYVSCLGHGNDNVARGPDHIIVTCIRCLCDFKIFKKKLDGGR